MGTARSPKPHDVKPKWVAVSGGFDPLHVGHVRMMEEARQLGDKLVVILNNDNWLRAKKGFVFMPQEERIELLKALPFVDKVYVTKHPKKPGDMSVSAALEALKPAIFANGGDRDKKDATSKLSSLNADQATCQRLGIEMVYSMGAGGKVQSSSWMIRDAVRGIARSVRPWGEFYSWNKGEGWYLKTIHIAPRKRLSLQYHLRRGERWVLVEGDATAVIASKDGIATRHEMPIGEIFSVPQGAIHRLESKKGGVVVEIALGDFDENDIVRIEDDFGRN